MTGEAAGDVGDSLVQRRSLVPHEGRIYWNLLIQHLAARKIVHFTKLNSDVY